ncbi:MAG: SoxR reducing system RseC family protein [Desulfitobacteriaceae bacterium]
MKKNETEGIVVEIKGEFALVRPTAHTGCESSYCCQGEGVQKVNVEMKNEINAAVGDKVIFEAREGGLLLAAFIIFILPFILIIFGAVAGYNISEILRINATVAAIIGGILLFVISMIIIKMFDKSASKNESLKPVIIRKA